ncbi:MAG: hypothetical protein MK116_10150 [Phycisphaerales bacterium]|nr:hypothetical protein [Phycisphaerales bacterium]
MLKYTTVVATLALSGIACAQEAVQWTEAEGGNDHWYAKVATPDGPSWSACQALAESLGGELISAPTIEERSWCRSTFGETYAIGLYQDTDADDYSEPAGGWRWLDGSAIDSDIWCIAEPDDGGGQDCAAGFFGSPLACVATGFCDQAFPAMLVEFSADCNDDGIVDYGQILDGSLADDDGNGIPDVCESTNEDVIQWKIEDGGNGHWYELVYSQTNWQTASDSAGERGGHLATPTTPEEEAWIIASFLQDEDLWGGSNAEYGPFIGGIQNLDSPEYSEPDGGWEWITGEPMGYFNAVVDNCCGGQDRLMYNRESDGEINWNDVSATDSNGAFRSYLIEWSADCNDDGIVDYGQILDGSLADDDGNGIPDICSCVGDITNDGVVDVDDILMILGTWGSNYQPADIDGSGIVDVGDLLIALDGWGNCA